MKTFWMIMAGTGEHTPMEFISSHQSLPSAQREAKELADSDGRAYYVFCMVGYYVKQVDWLPAEKETLTR